MKVTALFFLATLFSSISSWASMPDLNKIGLLSPPDADGVRIGWETSLNTDVYFFLLAYQEGEVSPHSCDGSEGTVIRAYGKDAYISGLLPDTTYAVRVCTTHIDSDEISPGKNSRGVFHTDNYMVKTKLLEVTRDYVHLKFSLNFSAKLVKQLVRIKYFEQDGDQEVLVDTIDKDFLSVDAVLLELYKLKRATRYRFEISFPQKVDSEIPRFDYKMTTAGFFSPGHPDW